MKLLKKLSSIIAIVFIMSVFMICLNTYSFKEKIDSLSVQRDTIVLNDAKIKIEYSIANGKEKIDYFGIDKFINDLKVNYNACDGMAVIDIHNNLIYSTYENNELQKLVQELNALYKSDEDYSYIIKNNKIFSRIYIYDSNSDRVGALLNIVNINYSTMLTNKFFVIIILIFLISMALLIYIMLFSVKKTKSGFVSNKRVIAFLLVFQLVTMLICFVFYEKLIIEYVDYTIENISSSIENNFSRLEKYNIDIDDINGIDTYINYIESNIGAVEKINIQKCYENNQIKYNFTYKASKSYINKIFQDNIIDTITIFIISVFFFLELSNVSKALNKNSDIQGNQKSIKIRSQSFLLFIAYNISIFFVPIQMMNIVRDLDTAINTDMLVGIPTSVEALMIALAAILSGVIIDKKGCKKIYIYGKLILASGFILSFISKSSILFILARLICGIGYGLCLITIRILAANCEENQISIVIAGINASAYASMNIGTIVGGYVGEYFGVSYTFIISAVICLVGYVFCELKMDKDIISPTNRKLKLFTILKSFISEKNLVLSIVFVLLPFSLASAFIDYFYPLYASNNLMLKLTDISKGYLLNGLIIVLIGVFINKLASKFLSIKCRFLTAALLQGIALILFGCLNNILGLYGAIVLISISMTYASGSYIEYYTSLEVVKSIGLAKSMSMYTLFDKIGAYLAPFIYGLILISTQKRIMLLGIYIIISIITFTIIYSKGMIKYGRSIK